MGGKGVSSVLACFSLFPLESALVYKYLQEKKAVGICMVNTSFF